MTREDIIGLIAEASAHNPGFSVWVLSTQHIERIVNRAVEAAVKECVTICERQRVKILKNPADPSWTEHLAEVQSAMQQRFSVEMGYPAFAEPKETFADSLARRSWEAHRAAPPEPPAKPEPATYEQAAAAYDGGKRAQRWVDFRDGWQAAERFHGIGGSK
jgi:hypothetical protein